MKAGRIPSVSTGSKIQEKSATLFTEESSAWIFPSKAIKPQAVRKITLINNIIITNFFPIKQSFPLVNELNLFH